MLVPDTQLVHVEPSSLTPDSACHCGDETAANAHV